MRRIMLTGGNGFFGTRFRAHYAHTFEIVSTDLPQLDILDADAVAGAINLIRPDVVVHAAAIALTGFCDANPEKCRAINVEGAVNVAKACAKVGASLAFLSSEQVYNGNPGPGPFAEEDPAVPDTVYGKNKLEAEGLLAGIVDRLWILRFTWMFGMPGRGLPVVNNILWDTICSVVKAERILCSKREFRGMTNIDDLIDRFAAIFEIPFGLYHIGSTNPLSRYEVVERIIREMGLGHRLGALLAEDADKHREKPRDVRLDTAKAAAFGLVFPDTPEAISRCVSDYSLRMT